MLLAVVAGAAQTVDQDPPVSPLATNTWSTTLIVTEQAGEAVKLTHEPVAAIASSAKTSATSAFSRWTTLSPTAVTLHVVLGSVVTCATLLTAAEAVSSAFDTAAPPMSVASACATTGAL